MSRMELDLQSLPGVMLRPRTEADRSFLAEVYASTRLEELARTGWPKAQIDAFLASQFAAQDAHYTKHFTSCSFYVVEKDGQRAGRLYLDTWPAEVRVVDIALLPPYRGQGLGTKLFRAIIAYADSVGLPVSIHVEQENPALRLYERLGFEHIERNGIYILMRRPKTP